MDATNGITATAGVNVAPAAPAVLHIAAPASTVTVGDDLPVTVTLFDALGNVATGYTGTVKLVTSGGDNVTYQFTTGTGADNGVHMFSVPFNAVGSQSLTVTDTTKPALERQSDFVVNPGAVNLSQSAVSAPASVLAGGMIVVTLTARDSQGDQENTGGLAVLFGLAPGSSAGNFGPVVDDGNGMYTALFTAGPAIGSDSFTATVSGSTVTHAPAVVTVTAGAVSLAQSVVSVNPSTVSSGGSATVTLTAKDSAGNPESSGGLSVVFGLGGGSGSGTFSPVMDNGNGTYTATFTATVAGNNTITATIGGLAVTSTPPAITVSSNPVSLAKSIVSVAPSAIQSGSSATVTLTAKDSNGNQEPSGGLTVVFVVVGGGTASGAFSAVTDHGNGTYTATFTGVIAGNNSITATINGNFITSTPMPVTVSPGPVSLAMSVVSVSPSTISSGGSASVTLTAKDSAGNQESSGGLSVAFGLGGGSASGTFSPVIDHGNGTYTATFTASAVGTNTITATIGGIAVTSTTPAITVSANTVSLAKSVVSVAPAGIQSGSSTTVTLTAKDSSGNQEPSGGLSVVFSLGSGTASGSFSAVTDHGNGTYTATFTGAIAGSNTITATINGNAVTSPSPTLTVSPGPVSLAMSVVSVSPSTISSGGSASVTLAAKDSAGNQESSGGLSIAFGLGNGSASGTFSPVIDHGNGTYTATFTGSTAGTNTITAAIGGSSVTSPVPTVTVSSAAPTIYSIFTARSRRPTRRTMSVNRWKWAWSSNRRRRATSRVSNTLMERRTTASPSVMLPSSGPRVAPCLPRCPSPTKAPAAGSKSASPRRWRSRPTYCTSRPTSRRAALLPTRRAPSRAL